MKVSLLIENQLSDRAAEYKKKQKENSLFTNLDAGDVEAGVDKFNNSTMCEGFMTTIGEIVEGSAGNMSDDQLDSDLVNYRRIARALRVKNVDEVVVLLDEDFQYDPQYVTREFGFMIRPLVRNSVLTVYDHDDFRLVREELNGRLYLYFATEEDANRFINQMDAAMNENLFEDIGKGWPRWKLIDELKRMKPWYKYDHRSDAELFRLLNKFDKERRQETLHKQIELDLENEEDDLHTPINDPKYNFEDPDREDEYEVESFRGN